MMITVERSTTMRHEELSRAMGNGGILYCPSLFPYDMMHIIMTCFDYRKIWGPGLDGAIVG